MIGIEWVAAKFFWYLFFMYFTLLYFTFHGMMAIGLTPSETVAYVVSSTIYNAWNLFSGYLIPRPVSYSPIVCHFSCHYLLVSEFKHVVFCYNLHIQPLFRQKIPVWWRWFCWICPVAWTYGLVAPNMVISKPRLMAETKLQHCSLQSTLASIVTGYGLLHWCISCSLWPLHLCSALHHEVQFPEEMRKTS